MIMTKYLGLFIGYADLISTAIKWVVLYVDEKSYTRAVKSCKKLSSRKDIVSVILFFSQSCEKNLVTNLLDSIPK